ncbi:MAG: hypothetical protein WCI05_09820 [Myxococcales bacterium]|jgi:hypothetical protein
MHQWHDQLGKRLLRGFFKGVGTFSPEEEVSPDAQRMDGYFVPNANITAHTDLLFRLGAQPTAFEVMSEAPSTEAVLECIRKVLNARHVFGLATPPKALPYLRILCAGKPRLALKKLGACKAPELGKGVYRLAEAFETGLVVLSEVEEVPGTLLLRLLGSGNTRKRALVELTRLPAGAPERKLAVRILVALRHEIDAKPTQTRTSRDKEFVMQTHDVVKQLRDEERAKGKREGKREAGKQMLLGFYRARFGTVPDAVQHAVERVKSEKTLLLWVESFATKSAEEIEAKVQRDR